MTCPDTKDDDDQPRRGHRIWSLACKDFQQGWADGRADLLADLDTELRKFLKEHRGY